MKIQESGLSKHLNHLLLITYTIKPFNDDLLGSDVKSARIMENRYKSNCNFNCNFANTVLSYEKEPRKE